MREFAEKFYKSKTWQKCREAYLKSQGGLCERCRARGLIVPAEIVHHKEHITPETVSDPNVLLNWSNLQCVCRQCHAELHNGSGGKRFVVDEYGRVTPTE